MQRFVDIHCHLLPGIDDGASDVEESLAMGRLAVEQGIGAITVTPHQLGGWAMNHGDEIRRRTTELQEIFQREEVPLEVLPGSEIRIEEGMLAKILSGELLTLGGHGRHVLIELPFEIDMPLEPTLDALELHGMVGILAHPERYAAMQRNPDRLEALVDRGCLMQVTTGSFTGAFGAESQSLAERMASRGVLHFVSTDAHGAHARRPRMRDGFEAVEAIAGTEAAMLWCAENPRSVFEGREVEAGRCAVARPKSRGGWSFWSRATA